MAGWIRLSRDIVNHWVYKNEKWRCWWIDLLLMASWQDEEILYEGIKVEVKRGQVFASVRNLAKRWNANETAVFRFLQRLEDDGMISRNYNEVKHQAKQLVKHQVKHLTICNYDTYQGGVKHQVKHQAKQEAKQIEESLSLYNNININNNNIQEVKNNPSIIPPRGYGDFGFSFLEPNFIKPFFDWLEYKAERNEKYKSERSLRIAYNHLLKLSNGNPETAASIVEQSVANGWQGLFELKSNQYGSNRKTQQQINDEQRTIAASVVARLMQENKPVN